MAKVTIYLGTDFLRRIEQMQGNLDTAIPKALEVGGEIAGRIMKSNLLRVVGKGTKYRSRTTGKLKDSLGVSPVKINDSGTYDIKVGFAEGRGKISNRRSVSQCSDGANHQIQGRDDPNGFETQTAPHVKDKIEG